jgi:hypothetical protein
MFGALAPLARANVDQVVYERDPATGGSEIWAANADGSDPHKLADGHSPALYSDGHTVAFVTGPRRAEPWAAATWLLKLINVDGSGERTACVSDRYIDYPEWADNGADITQNGAEVFFEYAADGNTPQIYHTFAGEDPSHYQTAELLYGYDPTDCSYFQNIWNFGAVYEPDDPGSDAPGPNGIDLAFTKPVSGGRDLYRGEDDGYLAAHLLATPSDFPTSDPDKTVPNNPAISPDAQHVVFSDSLDTTKSDLWMVDTYAQNPASTLTRLTPPDLRGSDPDWAPDNSYIVFSGYSPATGKQGLYRLNPQTLDVTPVLVNDAATASSGRLAQPHLAQHGYWGNGPNSDQALLDRYAPTMRYDSQESYFADSARGITDYSQNALLDPSHSVIATPSGYSGRYLSLDYLGSPYADGLTAQTGDYLDEQGDNQAAADSAHYNFGNQIYGRVVRSGNQIWLQYWFWYYYNSFEKAGFGLHEGDWEDIQISLNDWGMPEEAVYDQHGSPERCAWSSVEKQDVGGRTSPVVYVAVGSHASYYTPGSHFRIEGSDNAGGQEQVNPSVVNISGRAQPSWVDWPGQWGGTYPDHIGPFDNPAASQSPHGPASHGDAWNNPAAYAAGADDCSSPVPSTGAGASAPTGPVAPQLTATRAGDDAVISYQLPAVSSILPKYLLVSVDRQGVAAPAHSEMVKVDSLQGQVRLPLPTVTGPYVVEASAFTKDGVRGHLARTSLSP